MLDHKTLFWWWASINQPITMLCSYNTIKFFHKYLQKTPHSSPVRVRYGVCFVGPVFGWYSESVLVIFMQYFPILVCVITALHCLVFIFPPDWCVSLLKLPSIKPTFFYRMWLIWHQMITRKNQKPWHYFTWLWLSLLRCSQITTGTRYHISK